VSRKEIAKQVDLGVRLEMRHNPKVSAITPELRREQASEIARNNIAKRLDYYQHYDKHMQESLRYDLDQKYDEYGMPDYTKYLNAISRFVRYTKSKGEIIQRLLKQFPNIDKRDAKMLINRWEVVKHHRRKDAESLISEEKQYALYINGKPTVRHSSRTEIEKHIAYLKSKGIKGEYDIRFVDFSPRKTSTTLGEEKDVDDWSDEDLKNLSLDMQKAAKEFKAEYKKLNKQRAKYGLEPIDINEASGYIPSEAERNDPRFSRALSVDVHPDTMKKQAKAMGLGNIARDGRPPLLRPGKSTTKKKSNPNKDFGKGVY
jgi:hypothetical protein